VRLAVDDTLQIIAANTETGGTGNTAPFAIGSNAPGIAIRTTQPQSILRHNISDEQLDALVNANRDGLADWMWGFAGIAVGLFPASLESVIAAYSSSQPTPLSVTNLGEIVACAVCLSLAVIIRLISGSRKNRSEEIARQIRSNPSM
jgi:hypothetical protein